MRGSLERGFVREAVSGLHHDKDAAEVIRRPLAGDTLRGYNRDLMQSPNRQKLQARIKRIAGQVAGVQRMLDEDRYCVDILNQISAVRSALDALGVELLGSHLESCVLGHGSESQHAHAKPMAPRELVAELQTTLSRFLK